MLTYQNDPQFKTDFMAQIAAHEAADQFIKGTYGTMNGAFKGCAVGCSLHSLNVLKGRPATERTGDHSRLAEEMGWPLWLAYLEDNVFEMLPDDLAASWPRRLSEAIPVGVEIPDRVLAEILHWTLAAETFGVRHATDNEEVRGIVDRMAMLFQRSIAGDEPSAAEWDRAAWDARAARDAWAAWAARDARAARAAWAAWAAWDAWDARAARAARAAWDARAARAARAAWDGFYPALSEFVIARLSALQP